MSTSTTLPFQRGLTLLASLALLLGALLPLFAPAPTRAVSDNIVISEFRVRGPGGAGDEFVELHNRSAAAVDIGGWSLRRSNNSATFFGTQVTFPPGTLIGPGCFFLVTHETDYSGAVPADATYAIGID